MFWQHVSLNCPVLLKNITQTLQIPTFFFSLTKHTRSKVTWKKTKTKKKTQALSWRHLAVAKQRVPWKQKKQNKTKKSSVSCFVLMSVWLMNPPCQWFEAAKLTGDTCVHWQTLNSTSQHHRKLTNHCNAHQLRWFQTKALLCLKKCKPHCPLENVCKCRDVTTTLLELLAALCDYLWLWCR